MEKLGRCRLAPDFAGARFRPECGAFRRVAGALSIADYEGMHKRIETVVLFCGYIGASLRIHVSVCAFFVFCPVQGVIFTLLLRERDEITAG